MSNLVRILRVRSATGDLAWSCWNTLLDVPRNKDRTACPTTCVIDVRCHTAIKLYQRRPMIRHYAILNHDVRCRKGLTLSEMGWYVAFSESVVSVLIDGRHSKKYPMPFNGPSLVTMALRQTSNPVFSGQQSC
ncbi:hypothetical protein TNCV_1467681 [Trichonephila clavipes]|uniref:Uncharacterized protein n=1 Tax=Trichonephila clavipes TaxID=2585209 RepID=A0A8X6S4D6_TRICX|nr:hypothetical protein TNCV_1467681 [Trichonephila clavipes]